MCTIVGSLMCNSVCMYLIMFITTICGLYQNMNTWYHNSYTCMCVGLDGKFWNTCADVYVYLSKKWQRDRYFLIYIAKLKPPARTSFETRFNHMYGNSNHHYLMFYLVSTRMSHIDEVYQIRIKHLGVQSVKPAFIYHHSDW